MGEYVTIKYDKCTDVCPTSSVWQGNNDYFLVTHFIFIYLHEIMNLNELILKNKCSMRLGCDVDNTLTDTPPFKLDVIDLEETRKMIRCAPVKKGVDILRTLNIKPFMISGRGDYYHDDTLYWLDKNNIPHHKLITIDRNKYPGNRFNLQEYLAYKVDAYTSNNITYCLEDDEKVIKELEKYGIKCSLVTDNFEKAFHRLFDEE